MNSKVQTRYWVVSLLALSSALGCDTATVATETGNPDVDGPGPTPTGNITYYCEWELFDAAEDRVRDYSCGSVDDPAEVGGREVRCDCDGNSRAVDQDGADCLERLERTCDVELTSHEFCDLYADTCWAGEDKGDWHCSCDAAMSSASTIVPVKADSCRAAAFQSCSSSCKSELGECAPQLDELTYSCECADYAATRTGMAASCDQALDQCDPARVGQMGSFGCQGKAGFCDLTLSEANCFCLDGGPVTLTYGEGVLLERGFPPPESLEAIEHMENEECLGVLAVACGTEKGPKPNPDCIVTFELGRTCQTGYALAGGGYDCECFAESDCRERVNRRFLKSDETECEEAVKDCAAADAMALREAPDTQPACPEDGATACSEIYEDEFCSVQQLENGSYHCECSPIRGDADPRERVLESDSCFSALDTCFEEE